MGLILPAGQFDPSTWPLMAVNIALSGLALVRQSARQSGVPAANAVELFLDRHYPDQRLERVYPTLHRVA